MPKKSILQGIYIAWDTGKQPRSTLINQFSRYTRIVQDTRKQLHSALFKNVGNYFFNYILFFLQELVSMTYRPLKDTYIANLNSDFTNFIFQI